MTRLARGLVGLCAAGLFALAPVAQGATIDDAQSLVKSTADKVLVRLKQDRAKLEAKPDLIYPLVEDLVLPHFDFEKMSQWVLGPAWRQASAEQRQRFTVQFRNLLVRTYAKALLEYNDQTINYLPVQAEPEAQKVMVKTQVVQKGSSYPISIDYAMYLKGGEWKVYDIAVDNVSLVSNYRKTFATYLRQETVDQLIARLETMNQQGTEKSG